MNFKTVDSCISDEHVKSFIKSEYKPKKVQSHLSNRIFFDLELFNTSRAVPYAVNNYKLNKRSGKCNRDITRRKIKNVKLIVLFLRELIVKSKCQIMFQNSKERRKRIATKLLKIIFLDSSYWVWICFVCCFNYYTSLANSC